MRTLGFLCAVLLFTSACSTVGRIKTKLSHITSVPDAGKPATLNESREVATLPLPAGSRLTTTKFEAIPYQPATETGPEVAPQPAREVTEVVVPKETEWRRTGTRIIADTGTVDTSIAKHRIDAQENRYLLFAALGAAIAAGFFLYIKYPTPALICGAASIIFFLAWKLSDLPSWFYVVGVGGLTGAFCLWRGHEKGEIHATSQILGTPAGTVTARVTAPTPTVQ